MDERLINCKAAPVFLYHGIWHSIYLKDGNTTVGNPLPSVHNYDEDETASEEALLRGIDLQIRHSPVKNPNSSPAPHWYPYEPEVSGNAMNAYTHTLAKIAYQGNVGFGNFVQPVQPNSTVSMRNDGAKLSMNLLSINRMDRAMYGTSDVRARLSPEAGAQARLEGAQAQLISGPSLSL
jgi:hypothetical protein